STSVLRGPAEASPPAAAAFEVPTAGVPTYRVASPLRAAALAAEATTTGAAGAAGRAAGAAAVVAVVAAAAGAAAGASPARAAISASVNSVCPVRLRRREPQRVMMWAVQQGPKQLGTVLPLARARHLLAPMASARLPSGRPCLLR